MRTIPENLLARAVRAALLEDVGPGDLTCSGLIPEGLRARGIVTARSALVLAGSHAARMAFLQMDPQARVAVVAAPGARIAPGETILEVEGLAAAILAAERTALNFLGRLSGIATLTRACADAVAGTAAAVYDTRKTTPGLRLLEKEAVALGGGRNHRFGLFDAVLIKDNHLALAGGPGAAVLAARAAHGPGAAIEVEVVDLAGLDAALAAGADIVLLDNMPVPMVAEAVKRKRAMGSKAELEASGGIALDNIRAYAEAGVDRISIGALTHAAPSADVSLDLHPAATERT